MSVANRDSFTSSFPGLMAFITFCCLLAWARISSTLLNRCDKSRHPFFLSDLWRKQSFPIKYVSCGFLVASLYQTEEVNFYY